MVPILVRKVEASNMFFSSWVLVFLAIGLIIEEWAELKLGPQKHTITHSSWICCTSLWPSGQSYYMERDVWRMRVHPSLTSVYLTIIL